MPPTVLASRMGYFSLFGLWLFALILLTTASDPAMGSHTALSADAQTKISKAITAKPNRVLVFDMMGDLQNSVRVTPKDEKEYKSLEQFIQAPRKTPVDSCKNPTAVPPPPCILCDDGHVVCAGAKLWTGDK